MHFAQNGELYDTNLVIKQVSCCVNDSFGFEAK